MNRQDLIEMAHVNTERKYEKIGNMNNVFALVLQDFCARSRFWWRKMSVSFSTVAGTSTYDLSTLVTVPVITEIAVEEITQLILVQPGSNPPTTPLVPIFDDAAMAEMEEGINVNGQSAPAAPSRYLIDGNGFSVLRIDNPDNVYKLRMTFWAMPNPASDSTNTAVPLVPPWHHKAVLSGMEAYVWGKIYGPTNAKVLTAKKEYEDHIINAQARARFSTNFSQQLTQTEDAVRST